MLNKLLKKLALKFSGNSLFEYSVEKQKRYLAKFREPRSEIERSYFQYRAQMKLKGFIISTCFNIVSLPLLILYSLKFSKRIKDITRADAVHIHDGLPKNILPSSLVDEFDTIKYDAPEGSRLNWRDRWFIFKLLLRYPFSWHFVLKAEIKIMRYRWFIDLCKPKALIVHNEYSFTSSLLTDFCNKNSVELINVMHGEKLFHMRDSFFKFNRCYIWSEFYKELFMELRADPDQFVVEVPPSLLFEKKDTEKTVDYTYYLQAQHGEKLEVIVSMLTQLQNKGYIIAIRPHPRYTNLEELNRYIGEYNIEVEKCKELSIEDSILRTKNVISIYSTVLVQANYNGTNVVIDDLTDPELIEKLRSLKYIMLNEKHILLSDLLKNVEALSV